MRIALMPGTFNPFHEGHLDIVKRILPMFDKIYVLHGINSSKECDDFNFNLLRKFKEYIPYYGCEVNTGSRKIVIGFCRGLLVDHIKRFQSEYGSDITIIKGLRDAKDFEYEKIQQYWNEDLGLKYPVMYMIADRNKVHISSSAIRMINKFKEKE